MKAVIFCAIFAVVVMQVLALPVDEIEEKDGHLRFKRFTCDVLGSISYMGVSMHDNPCSIKCRMMGSDGGHCDEQKECHCN
ncbi:tenecin-1-like [Diabrotica virgifera virgifera]|uniref:Tenecin-1-like n=1 Tax=Diabrotica virgifera virgifera TaxID=50390 RepID=A0A6P7GH08_DIAVI|nr:tenecin-1-like [Diabrotica virgifera virgifera]XP_050504998.1 tenecin-1-like [Diabrotica virgifera virgifera]